MDMEDQLNPAQQEVLELLGASRDQRPTFDDGLRTELRYELEQGLAPVIERLPRDENLFINKFDLHAVHGCEAKFLHEREERFEWTVPRARGSVTHKAVELSVHWRRGLIPLDLVDEALARLEQAETGFGEWLQAIDEADRAELRADCGDRVTKFLESFPPLKTRWRPVTESRQRAELLDQRVVLNGKVDLSLGSADGLVAGKVLIDLKTGRSSPEHVQDLRFYALLETMRVGTPPRRVATYYLDQGRPMAEDTTEAILDSTVARVIGGAEKMVNLTQGLVMTTKRPSLSCRWCPLRDSCEEGRRFLADDDERMDVYETTD